MEPEGGYPGPLFSGTRIKDGGGVEVRHVEEGEPPAPFKPLRMGRGKTAESPTMSRGTSRASRPRRRVLMTLSCRTRVIGLRQESSRAGTVLVVNLS